MKRSFVASALAAVTLSVSGMLAAPASAGTNCDSGHHCVFYSTFASARKQFFNGNPDFTRYTFAAWSGGSAGAGQPVNDNNWSLSNSSSGGYYSEYYLHINYAGHGGVGDRLVCLKPGASIAWFDSGMPSDGIRGNGVGVRDEASSLFLDRTPPNPGLCLG